MSDTPVPAGYPCSVHPVFDGTGWYCPVHHRMASVCIDEARAVPVEPLSPEEEGEAREYADDIRRGIRLDWVARNNDIVDNFSRTALVRIKRRAWAIVTEESE